VSRNLSPGQINTFRARLCAVAERQFAERGIHGVTMRQLAEELGCSAMTPYRYFRDKEEILAAVRAAALERFSAALEAAHRGRGNAATRGRAVGAAYLRFAFEQPHAYRLIFDLTQPDARRYPELVGANARACRTMTAYMEDLVAEGALAGDPELLGCLFWAAVHGLVALQTAGKLPATRDFPELHRAMIRLLARGARSGAAQRPAPRRRRAN
jgi:AcrR family transcriptional regulator